MDLATYKAFTLPLVKNLSRDERVLGLVAVGSMAATAIQPDKWSDHDFLVVTEAGVEDEYRDSIAWLPPYRSIVLKFRETRHGRKILYDDGHLLEYAFFNCYDFHLVKINSYRILIDRAGFKKLVESVVSETRSSGDQAKRNDELLFGQFITHLLVGYSRHARGEKINGAQFVKHFALEDLIGLVTRHIPAEDASVLDNIATTRRFELAYPGIGGELNAASFLDTPQCALAFLALAERELCEEYPVYNAAAVAAVRKAIDTRVQHS